jgi:flagellar biosynthesis/type III secretory pathway protein FliH
VKVKKSFWAVLVIALLFCFVSYQSQLNDFKERKSAIYDEGYDAGYDNGLSDGHYNGYSEGYDEGYDEGLRNREDYVIYNSFHEQYKNFRSAIAGLMYDGEYEAVRILLKYNREDVEDALEYEFGVTDLTVIIDYLEG